MNRLNLTLTAVAAAFLANACSSQGLAPADQGQPARRQINETGTAAVSITAVTLAPQQDYQPAGSLEVPDFELPALPLESPMDRKVSELQEIWKNGVSSYADSPNTLDNNPSKTLVSVEGNFSWAMYQFPLQSTLADLQSISVELSQGNFDGERPGYWVGIANYASNKWQILSNTTQMLRTFEIFNPSKYLSNGGNVYFFIALAGIQSVNIDRVGVSYNPADWIEVEVDSAPTRGWMPSVVYNRLDEPLVAYVDSATGFALLVKGDPTKGLDSLEGWQEKMFIDNNPSGGTGIDDTNAKCKWTDIMIHPFTGLPVVSLIYDEIQGKEENSRTGLSEMRIIADTPTWFNYRFGYIDDAEWTSIDVYPGTTQFGIATHARNTHWGDREPFDMYYVTFNTGSPEQQYQQSHNFGADWNNPHLKYVPANGKAAVHVHGGNALLEISSEQWNYFNKIEPLDLTNEFGSLAVNPVDGLFGGCYTAREPALDSLTYIDYDADYIGMEETIDTMVRSNGVAALGNNNQLAYKSDGTPAIAYVEFDGNFAIVKYAERTFSGWEVLQISAEESLINDPGDMVVVDLAFDSQDRAAVCFNQLNQNDECTLHVALKGY